MKNFYLLRRGFTLLLAGLWAISIQAQVQQAFESVDLSSVNSGFLYAQVATEIEPPDGSQYDVISIQEARQFFFNLNKACLNSTSFIGEMSDWNNSLKNVKSSEHVVPITIVEMRYHDLANDALANGLIGYQDGHFVNGPDMNNGVFVEKKTLFLWPQVESFSPEHLVFRLDESGYFQNYGSMPQEIKIDFDDGFGWRTVLLGLPITVDYSNSFSDRHIRMEIYRDGEVKKSGVTLKSNDCSSAYSLPTLPPWPLSNNAHPWEISVQVDGNAVSGNAYTLASEDGVFDKPFIFVEGIDFGDDHSDYRNGDFGWCQFTSGSEEIAYNYAMLHRMPELLDALRGNGYDIVLLDFNDGTTWIQNNGQLLIALINLCNQYKSGSDPLVIAGASMGGQVSRYALSYMESIGQDHCTRLWISLDSPHRGANIPIALQSTLKFLAAHVEEAESMFFDDLKSPAAQQMLIVQTGSQQMCTLSPVLKNDWYDELNLLGFPKKCRKIAIANGNADGYGIGYTAFDPLLNEVCDATVFLPGPEHHYYLMPLPGDLWHSDSNDNQKVIAELEWTKLVNGALVNDQANYYAPPNSPRWDYAPGGKINSIKDFVRAFNTNAEYLESCGVIDEDQYNEYHNFIPTTSALGIETNDPFLDVREYLSLHPDACPFDRWIAPESGNERHSEISQQGLDLVIEETLGSELPGGQVILPQVLTSAQEAGPIFNFGKESFSFIDSISISDGGILRVNRFAPLHFGNSEDGLPELGSDFQLKTLESCADVVIEVGNNGLFEIGDPQSSTTACFIMKEGSEMIVSSEGVLQVYQGSRIKIDKGATLRLQTGSQLIIEGGYLEIMPGGLLMYEGGEVFLNGSSSKIVLSGGRIEIADGKEFSINHSGPSSGFVEVNSDNNPDIVFGNGSTFLLEGTDADDLILKINNWSILSDQNAQGSAFKLFNGQVDLTGNGDIWLGSSFTASGVSFVDYSNEESDRGDIIVWWNNIQVKNCNFYEVAINGYHVKSSCYVSSFTGAFSGIYSTWGSYRVDRCSFGSCGVSSTMLENVSRILSSNFQNVDESLVETAAVIDKSLVEIEMKECEFYQNSTGIRKFGGKLSLRCNSFEQNSIAIYAAKGAIVNMSSMDAAGYNAFDGNGTNLQFENAGVPLLQKGFNQLWGFSEMNITGSIGTLACNSSCGSANILASNNSWDVGGGQGYPDPNFIDLRTSSICNGGNNCSILVVDTLPQEPQTCPAIILIAKPGKKLVVEEGSYLNQREGESIDQGQLKDASEEDPTNPHVYVEGFGNIPLDSSLVIASMQMEIYDSTANNVNAVNIFHNVLSSGLDKNQSNVRWLMEWGVTKMKTAIESMFSSGQLSVAMNTSLFEPPVQQYVDILNLMTDSVLTDSTYRNQFYIELSKGQLFRTLQRPETAHQIFSNLDNCQLDSLEQTVLNYWLSRVSEEMEFAGSVGEEPEELDEEELEMESAENYSSSNYYFGTWINGPSSLEFVSCGSDLNYRSAFLDSERYEIFPNPSDGHFTLRTSGDSEKVDIALFDITGRKVASKCFVLNESTDLNFDDMKLSGTYVLRIEGDSTMNYFKLVIE